LAWSGSGCPFSSNPFDQFVLTNSDETSAWPVARSSTKNLPLRDACASILRGCPANSPSISTAVCVASQSWVSCGDDWKYHFIFPSSGFSATMLAVNRLSPVRLA